MKLSTIIIIALLAFIAWRASSHAPTPPSAAARAESTPAPPPTPPERTTWKREDFAVVRGIVADVGPQGLLVEIAPPVGYEFRHVDTGGQSSPGLADMVISQEKKQYGPMMATVHSHLVATNLETQNAAAGTILLKGHPDAAKMVRGNKIKVLAAPLNPQRGTATYTLAYGDIPPEPPGEWFRKKQEAHTNLPTR